MFKYLCSECGKGMKHSRNNDMQMVKDEESGKGRKTQSLGTWKCVCGNKKVRRVKGEGNN